MDKISAHQIEYLDGATSWIQDALKSLKLELHPLLAEIQSETVAELTPTDEHSPETAELASPLYRGIAIQHKVKITLDEVLEGDIDALLSMIFEFDDEMGRQLAVGVFEHIGEVSDVYGRTIRVGDDGFVEAFIRSLESVEISFNTDGSPATKLYMHPSTSEVLFNHPPTPEQQKRIDDIVSRKREEWHASRRRQELP